MYTHVYSPRLVSPDQLQSENEAALPWLRPWTIVRAQQLGRLTPIKSYIIILINENKLPKK